MAKRWKTCFDVRANLISTKVSASHRKSTQVHTRPGQTESQVDPSFQLASTCDSVWPGLKPSFFEQVVTEIRVTYIRILASFNNHTDHCWSLKFRLHMTKFRSPNFQFTLVTSVLKYVSKYVTFDFVTWAVVTTVALSESLNFWACQTFYPLLALSFPLLEYSRELRKMENGRISVFRLTQTNGAHMMRYDFLWSNFHSINLRLFSFLSFVVFSIKLPLKITNCVEFCLSNLVPLFDIPI